MNTKALWIVLIIVLVAIGAWYAFAQKDAVTPTENTAESSLPAETAAADTEEADIQVATVTYTDSGFSPKTLTISTGDTVRFVNQSSGNMWVGADEHPTHTEYDGTSRSDHCPNGSSFDQCSVGASYEFTFAKVGTFDYHNHVRAVDGGTIVVE